MAVAFFKGQTLTANDLNIIVRDVSGVPTDPYYIRYSLFDVTTGVEVLIGSPDRIPATTGTGQYYVNAAIPLDANIGNWLVRWHFRETAVTPLIEVVQEFNVVADTVQLSVTGSSNHDIFVRRLRIILRDNNPDRNYSVGGEEKIDIDANGKRHIVSLEELWAIIQEGENGNL